MRTGLIILAAIAGTLNTACMKTPDVRLTDVRVGGVGLRGATLIAELNITNPNRLAMEADSVTYALEASNPRNAAAWSPVTSGTSAQRVRVEKQTSARVEIPIDFPYAGLGVPLRSLLENGMLHYRLSGTVFVRKPLPKSVPFREEGTLSL